MQFDQDPVVRVEPGLISDVVDIQTSTGTFYADGLATHNCYAARQALRHAGDFGAYEGLVRLTPNGPRWTGLVDLIESKLEEPLHWTKPARIFVDSMSDLFHESLPDETIDRVFAVMALCPQHTFQVLTKRAERLPEYASHPWVRIVDQMHAINGGAPKGKPYKYPLPNVWLGVSIENRACLWRADKLRETPAAIRFLSLEPLLEDLGTLDLRGIDWVIVGGESGPCARPFDLAWARSTIAQCRAAGVPCFLKQLGAKPFRGSERFPIVANVFPLKLKDRKGGCMSEWSSDLRVREYPK